MKKPVQLIRFDSNKNVQLTQQAIDIFSKLESKQLCIVCVAGKYRTGKSYILNRVILQQNNGFQVGPTINACTKGLWMWPQIVKINYCGHVKQCIIIDTQGLGSLQQGESTDLKIFLLAMLLSSYLIYNSVGSIDQKALQSLNLVINMAQLLQKTNNSYDSQQLINTFPQFMWLVRDFSLRLENQNGEIITSKEYLQTALSQKKGKTAAAERKNAIRRQLKTFFKERDCFTLIRPTLNEKDLQNLSTLSQKKLRPQFLELIKELKSRIHSSIQPKKLRGKSLTPQGFIQLCKVYIGSINSGKLPTISSSWEKLCISESSRVVKKYEMRLREYVLSKQMIGEQIEAGELTQVSEKLLTQSMQMIDRSFLGKLQKKLLKQKLQKTKGQTMSEIMNTKYNSIEQRIEKKVQQLLEGQQLCEQNKQLREVGEQQQQQQQVNQKNREQNYYFKIDKIKNTFSKFQQLINCQQLSSNNRPLSMGISSKKHVEFIRRQYKQLMQHIQEKVLTLIQQEMYIMGNQNKLLKQRLKTIEERINLNINQEKDTALSIRKQLQQKQRQINKLQMINKQLSQQTNNIRQLQLYDQLQIKQLSQTIQSQTHQHQQSMYKLQQQHNKQLKHIQSIQQQKIYQLQQSIREIKQQLHQLQIKERKLNRQCEIYKQKLLDQQKYAQNSTKEIQQFKSLVMKLQKDNRSLLRKITIINNNMRSNNKKNNMHSQQSINYLYDNDNNSYQHQLQQQPHDNSNKQQLLTKTNLLQQQIKQLQQQLKLSNTLYHQQQTINNMLINTPQHINYQSLKKNYLSEKHNSLMLSKKIKMYQTGLSYVNKVKCCMCGQMISKNNMLSNTSNAHYMRCITNTIADIQFDVSYVYNQQGELMFLFQTKLYLNNNMNESIIMNKSYDKNLNDVLNRLDDNSNRQKRQIKYQLTKSLKSIRLLLKTLKKNQQSICIFNQQNQQKNNHIESTSANNISTNKNNLHRQLQQQRINLNEKRRLYLDEECHQLKHQINKNNLLIEFFHIDLHLLRYTKLYQHKTKSTSILSNKINTNNMMKTRRLNKKIGMLNLDLGQIIQQQPHHQNNYNNNYSNNNNNNSNNTSKRILSQSVNFNKTTKFSMKKVFKFNNNL